MNLLGIQRICLLAILMTFGTSASAALLSFDFQASGKSLTSLLMSVGGVDLTVTATNPGGNPGKVDRGNTGLGVDTNPQSGRIGRNDNGPEKLKFQFAGANRIAIYSILFPNKGNQRLGSKDKAGLKIFGQSRMPIKSGDLTDFRYTPAQPLWVGPANSFSIKGLKDKSSGFRVSEIVLQVPAPGVISLLMVGLAALGVRRRTGC